MPENRCELVFVQSGELPSTKPLRVITQYSSADDINMQSPGRPTTLGVCVAAVHNNKDGKEGTVVSRISGMEENSQSWSAKMVDNGDFEKLLGQLGSNGSTPVTPTSFLNPRNITEDQEIFADNFSRTLNKVKAEQEGWGAAECDASNDSMLRPQSHSPPNTCLRAGSSTFREVRSSMTELVSLPSSSIGQPTRAERPLRSPSHRTGQASPQLTDPPLVLTSATSLSSGLPHLRAVPAASASDARPIHSSSKGLLPSADFDLTHNSSPSLGNTNTTWTTGLPTILSIASSLKDVYADRRLSDHVNPEHSHLNHPSDLSISLHTSSSPHSAHQSLFTLENRNSVNGCISPGQTSPAVLLRYAIPDSTAVESTSPIGSGTSYHNGTSNGNLGGGTLNSSGRQNNHNKSHTSPINVCPPLQNTNFTREDMYNSSDSSSLTSSLGLLPSILSTTTTELHSPVGLSSTGKTSAVAFLLTSNTAVTSAPVSLPINSGHLVRSSDGKQSQARMTPSSTASSTTTSTGSGLSNDALVSCVGATNSSLLNSMSIIHDSNTGTLFINSGSQLQQLPTLYPGVNGALDLATTDDLPSNFVFHPNLNGNSGVPASFGSHLTTRMSNSSSFFCNSQINSTADTNAATDDCTADLMSPATTNGSVLCSGITFCRLGAAGESTQRNTPDSASNMLTDTTGTHLPSFSNIQTASTGSSRKTKRSGKKNRSSSSNVAPVATNQPNGHPSVSDNGPGPNSYINQTFTPEVGSKSTPKRSREPCDTGQTSSLIFPPVQSLRDTLSLPVMPIPSGGQLLYMTDSNRTVLIKSEATVLREAMDDESTHSESISADTGGGAIHGQSGCGTTNAPGHTPPSSVDDMDQHHLKLERKRARNRVAARRCRERKISLIRSLEIQVAERDAHVRCLENLLAQYRSEGERLRKHMEILANSYPSLRAELYHYPVLFQQQQQQQGQLQPHNSTPEHQPSGLTQPSATEMPECVTTKHFS